MQQYLKLHIWEFFFTFSISMGLALNIMSSYVIPTTFTNNYLLIAVAVLVVNALVFLAGYNKKTAIVGSGVGYLLLVVVLIYLRSIGWLTFDGSVDNSRAVYWAILIIAPIITYLLTRNRIIAILYVPMCTVVCAAFAFLEYPVSIPGFVLMVVGLVFEILYKVYYESVLTARYGSFNMKHFFLQTLSIVLISIIFSGGIYYGIVKPLSPPTQDLKLITKLMSWDVLEKIGVASQTEIENSNVVSNKTNDKQKQTNKKNNEENKDKKDEQKKDEDKIDESESNKDESLSKDSGKVLNAFAISYEEYSYVRVIIALIILLILMSPFAIKYLLRRNRKKKIYQMQPQEGIVYLYNFFLKDLKRVGLERPSQTTLFEYVDSFEKDLKSFDSDDNITFRNLTEVYVETVYGNITPNLDKFDLYKSYYRSFYKNLKSKLGTFKYSFKFWVL